MKNFQQAEYLKPRWEIHVYLQGFILPLPTFKPFASSQRTMLSYFVTG